MVTSLKNILLAALILWAPQQTQLNAAVSDDGDDVTMVTRTTEEQQALNEQLYIAVKDGNVDHIIELIAAGADVNARNANKRTPLFLAISNGHTGAAITLIAAHTNLHARTREGDTPLHQAARFGRINLIHPLVTAGADINARNKDGITPLHMASMRFSKEGHTAITTLIALGADINACDNRGQTPLHYSVELGEDEYYIPYATLLLWQYEAKRSFKSPWISQGKYSAISDFGKDMNALARDKITIFLALGTTRLPSSIVGKICDFFYGPPGKNIAHSYDKILKQRKTLSHQTNAVEQRAGHHPECHDTSCTGCGGGGGPTE